MACLEQLDGELWAEPAFPSHLVTTCHRLRKKDIGAFSVEDLRIMVGQGIGLRWLAPRAIAALEEDPFAQGDFYPGDLLAAVMRRRNWSALEEHAARIEPICRRVLAVCQTAAGDGDIQLGDGRVVRPSSINLTSALLAYLDRANP